MSIIERAKNICLTPATEWPVIAAEPTSPGTLVSSYVVPLAAVGAIAGFIGGSLIGHTLPLLGTYRVPLVTGLVAALFTFCMAIVGVFILSLIINALAPKFGGQQNSTQALKVAVYSFTPGWIAGVLQIVPVLGIFAIFAALYGLYLLYLGLPRLMKCPEDKAVAYTAVVVVCAIVLFAVAGMVGGMITGTGLVASRTLSGAAASPSVEFEKNSALGRLQELGAGSEKTAKVGGRIVHERISKTGGTNEFGVVLGDRFVVSAHGNGVGIDELRAAISNLDLGRLESMKDVGVQK